MGWLIQSLSSSLGKKVLMASTGLFLCTFLVVHLIGNLQLLKCDNGEAFNIYAAFMGHNPLINFVSYGLYATIILHAIVGTVLTFANKKARPIEYGIVNKQSSWASRSMMLLGTLLLVFIILHMKDFWFEYKVQGGPNLETVSYEGKDYKNIYALVVEEFHEIPHLILYVLAQFVLCFHLMHGFQSAFQTFGINHKKYTPAIKGFGWGFSIIVPLLYALLPLYIFFK